MHILLVLIWVQSVIKVREGAKIRNRYNQVLHLTNDTNGKVTNSQLDTTDESQEVSCFPAGDHKHILTDAHKGIANIRKKNIKYPHKKYRLGTVVYKWRTLAGKYFNEFYFRILVLDKGQVKEFDSPDVLLKDKKSIFYGMAKDAGLV